MIDTEALKSNEGMNSFHGYLSNTAKPLQKKHEKIAGEQNIKSMKFNPPSRRIHSSNHFHGDTNPFNPKQTSLDRILASFKASIGLYSVFLRLENNVWLK